MHVPNSPSQKFEFGVCGDHHLGSDIRHVGCSTQLGGVHKFSLQDLEDIFHPLLTTVSQAVKGRTPNEHHAGTLKNT